MTLYTLTVYVDQPGSDLAKTEIITSDPGSAALDVLRGVDALEGCFEVDAWELDVTTLPGPSVLSHPLGQGKIVIVGVVRSRAQLELDAAELS